MVTPFQPDVELTESAPDGERLLQAHSSFIGGTVENMLC